MLIVMGKDIRPELGSMLVKYIDKNCYKRGEVVEVNLLTLRVDFGDFEYEFDISEVSMVHTASNADHLMTVSPGRLVSDYRAKDAPRIDHITDLLDFENWI